MDNQNQRNKELNVELLELQNQVENFVEMKSEFLELKETLKYKEEILRNITSAALDAIIIINNEGEITFWNDAAEKIFGYCQSEITGRNLHEILAPVRYMENFRGGFESFKETGEGPVVNKTRELYAIRKNQEEFPMELSLSSFMINGKWQALGIIRDITKRKKLEEEKEQLIKELKEALNKIKTLKGLLPICSKCKKIRDDEGYWQDVDNFIRDNSDAELSHSLCPDCVKLLYPDLNLNLN